VASSDSGRANQQNHLAFVSAVNAKILVRCDHAVVWIKLAHSDQTKIGQIGLLVGITFGQVRQLRQIAKYFGDPIVSQQIVVGHGSAKNLISFWP